MAKKKSRMEKLLRQVAGENKKFVYYNGTRHEGMSFIFVNDVPSYNVRILQYAIEGEYALHELRHRFTGDFTVRPGENRIVPEVLEKIKRDWPEDYETLDLFEVRLRWNEVAEEIIRKSKENLEKQLRMIKALLEDPVVHKRKHYYINPEWD